MSVRLTSIGWGVVGCGWVTRDHVLPGMRALPTARLVGVHDRDRASAESVAGGATVCDDVKQLLDLDGLDAVYVATPNDQHRAVVEAAAASGLAVLCEKPLAADVDDAQAIVDACRTVVAGAAYDQRHHPAHRRIAEVVAAGDIGTVTAVRIVYGCWLPPDWSADNWRVDPARSGGGAVVDLAPHGVDLVGTLLGDDLETLQVLRQRRVHRYDVDDGGVLAGRTSGGVVVTMHVSFNTPDVLPRRRLEVVGTRGQLVAEDTMGQTAGGRLSRIDAAGGESVDVAFDTTTSPFTAQLDAFGAAVTGVAPWRWPLERDLRLHRLLHDALGRD